MYGINERGETACIYVDDFQPFFYVKVPQRGFEIGRMISEIKKKTALESYELVEKKSLYGFTANNKMQFVKLVFKNTMALAKAKALWTLQNPVTGAKSLCYYKNKQGEIVYSNKCLSWLRGTQLFESNLPPMLRMFHVNQIWPNGWIEVNARPSGTSTTTCKYEYVCSQSMLKALPDKETAVPYKIMSFDIEAGSSHGDFPLPKKTYKRLAMNMVDVLPSEDINEVWFRNCVLSAFGHANMSSIDRVYPKSGTQSKKQIEAMIDFVLNTTVSDATKNANKETQRLLTLDTMFEKMRSDNNNTNDNDENDEDDVEDVDAEDADNEDDEISSNASFLPSSVKTNILDFLRTKNNSRDEQVQQLDQLLTSVFPPLEGDPITMIGSTFMYHGQKEPYMNHCITLGACAAVQGAVIETANSEQELLLRWRDLVLAEDPDIIIGYNIFGFDYEFMFRRAEETHCAEEFLLLSRKVGQLCGSRDKHDASIIELEHSKIAIASGEYDLRYINMGGRLQIDMYNYFRRNFQLSSYKLDDVASQNISDEVFKVEGAKLWTKNITGLHVGDFIHIEITSFTSDHYVCPNTGTTKFVVQAIEDGATPSEKIIVINTEIGELSGKKIRWTMAKDDVSPQEIFRMSHGSEATPESRAKVAKYCIQDCNLVHHLMRKIDVMTEYMEMANLCSVPINFLVFRGQGIKLTSYVAKKCMEKGYLMPDLENAKADGGYEGAIVLPPKTKIYIDEPVACVDYSSLYPSSMISQNYCHSSKVWAKEYDLEGNLLKEEGEKDATGKYVYYGLAGYDYVEIEFDTFEWRRNPANPAAKAKKTKVGKRVVCWAQLPNGEKSVMPSILMELLKAREETKKKAKKAAKEDPFMANILDKRQLAYKVSANSIYGQCGARTSTFYEKDVAASTTASGRMSITYARRIIEEIYANRVCEVKNANHNMVMTNAEYVYGDSVASYTPVYVKADGLVHILTIDQLASRFGNGEWRMCQDVGRQDKEVCEMQLGVETWTDKGWTRLHRVIRHALAPHKKMVRICTGTGIVDVTDDHSLVRVDGTEVSPKDVKVGTELLHNKLASLSYNNNNSNIFTAHFDNMLEAAEYTNYLNSMHTNFSLSSGVDQSIIVVPNSLKKQSNNTITKMHEIQYIGYVYDLTTENHHFAAGVGNMIVHNTDSVFFIFNLTNTETGEKITGKDALEITIELAQEAAHYATMFLKPPMNLAYEKTLMPFALLSKKRYVGILYEEDPNKGKLKYMGLSLKRRDSCDYLKDTYGQIINMTMKGADIMQTIQYLDNSLKSLIEGAVPTEKLEITKALRSYYKNPQQIAHRVLANRIGQRDPGNMPKAGDRMRFIHVVNPNKKALQGDKIETPEYIKEAKLKIDYDFYITNQLMKPICQFMGLALEDIWKKQGKTLAIKKYRDEITALSKEYPDFEQFIKKKEKLCSEKVKALLFDKHLMQIQNNNARNQPITAFFGKRG
jgi:DNA polymerase elongation subunit (family B)